MVVIVVVIVVVNVIPHLVVALWLVRGTFNINGFLPSYTSWIFHGENLSSPVPHNVNVGKTDSNDGDETYEMLFEGFGLPPPSFVHEAASSSIKQDPDEKIEKFFNLLKVVERELYPECHKFSTLSFIVRLLHIKCLSGWSDKSFTMLLELLKDSFLKGETLPKSFYATRKLLRDLGLDYHKVHACPRDCSLYWKETASMDDCIVCHMLIYKQFGGEENDVKKKQQRISQKIFASEPHNVRLGLAADGFNPFKAMNVSHSSWPVIMMPYNLPPWLCIKQPHMMMTLLIDGPSSPGNNIDVYLRLVVDELKELWENGVDTYDAETNQMFRMHVVLLWTINDFPAYAILSGWSMKGVLACPCCNTHTQSRYLKNGRKLCYMGHRRWLNGGHKFRKASASFDGTREFEPCPTRLSGANVLQQLGPKFKLNSKRQQSSKRNRKGKEKEENEDSGHNWKKKNGYASNISRRVNLKQRSIFGLKSHDNRILIQQILPIAVRNLLPKKVVEPLIELSNFFKQLCFKTLDVDGLNRLQSQIALTLFHLERIFPPSFFDIMEHLPIHLAEEAKIAGPVQYRWMYFVERYLMTLKSYMRNRSHPEGSIAQGYLVEECMTFCSRYLHDVESKLHRRLRNCDVSDNPQILMGRALGKGKGFVLDNTTWVAELLATENVALLDEIKILALGPSQKATRFNGYIINGTRYHTRSRELRRKTQNNGVMVKAKTSSYASAKDINPVEGDVAYYGYVTDIIELYYSHDHRYMLFMCNWIDNNKGLKQDDFGFTLVNFNHLLYANKQDSDEPFILASQAQQVFYVNDYVDEYWNVVLKMKPRDLYEVCGEQPTIDKGLHHNEVKGFGDQELDVASYTCEEDMDWVRQGIDGTTVYETIGPFEASTEAPFEDDEEMI
ncbi:uncharacterized protein LOC114303271 [Camellia sinensis]|uniref:uncharacterized protein LOC114303271 n=1 Tax=Camellia sinensis TaxID=4442 RepID=UPI001035844A|nr:uncharacterized protein LOC114303271 [Camellia sinensis]